ncbi:MAG: DUF456 domain-containing protein [Bacteroidia bacterium]
MPIWLIILTILLTLIGIAGCILPGLPGPPFNYAAVLLLHFNGYPFSDTSLILFGILTVVVLILDYTIPIFSARIFGATKTGIRGSIVGMIVGMFFTPLGMIGGLLLGAIIGDMMEGRTLSQASLSGAGTLLGALAGIFIKTIAAVIISFPVWYIIVAEVFK